MKNLFKFGFLGMALVIGASACNSNTSNDAEATADSLENVIEANVEETTEMIDSIGDAAIDTLDSLSNQN